MTLYISAAALLLLWCNVQSASLPEIDDVKSVDGDNQSPNRWLDDFDTVSRQDENGIYDVMQADSPVGYGVLNIPIGRDHLTANRKTIHRSQVLSDDDPDDEAPRCPPPILPIAIIRSWCSAASGFSTVHRCQVDGDCQLSVPSSASDRKRKCCHNGCRRVCAVPIDPAPYIDWKREPQTRLTSGKSWLIQGPDEPQEVEWCSTSDVYDDVTTDEEPLLCPSGYTCYIDDPGNVTSGIPNRGRCVPEQTLVETGSFKMAVSHKTADSSCAVMNVTYRHGETFGYEKHACKCEDGSVLCRVGRKAPVGAAAKRAP